MKDRYTAPRLQVRLEPKGSWSANVEVAVIPFTYEHTNVHSMTVNDAINIEADILAKYVESLIAARKTPASSRLTVSELIEEGF